jgi:hypothetical protein
MFEIRAVTSGKVFFKTFDAKKTQRKFYIKKSPQLETVAPDVGILVPDYDQAGK